MVTILFPVRVKFALAHGGAKVNLLSSNFRDKLGIILVYHHIAGRVFEHTSSLKSGIDKD
ncbi:MAG: hypothetical protein ACREBU_01325 [Nitrososphaera sp.]